MRGGKRKGAGRKTGPKKMMASALVLEAICTELDVAAAEKGMSRHAFLCAMLKRWAKRRGVDVSEGEERQDDNN